MKILRITIIMMSALLACACSSEQKEDIFDVPQTGYTFFEADFESVTLDGNDAEQLWTKGTGIGVYGSVEGTNEKYSLKKAFDGKSSGEFYGAKVSGDPVMAYYPYSDDFSLFEGKLMYSLSPLQKFDGTKGLYDQFMEYAGYSYAFSSNGGRLSFGYVSGLLSVEVRLSNLETIMSVELISKSPLAGTGAVDTDLSVSLSESGSRTIFLDCGEGIPSKKGDEYVKFPIVMPAGTYEGIALALHLKDKPEIVSNLELFEVERMEADAYHVKEVIISNGLDGFDVEGDLEFEPES